MTHVLIVEDEGLIAYSIETVVEKAGSTCTSVASVANARSAIEHRPDFVFLDVNVADGKTFELARELTEQLIPFVFTSASNVGDVPKDLESAPFVSKPFRVSAIEDALRRGLAGSGGSQASN